MVYEYKIVWVVFQHFLDFFQNGLRKLEFVEKRVPDVRFVGVHDAAFSAIILAKTGDFVAFVDKFFHSLVLINALV
jgi:hypothetical protein